MAVSVADASGAHMDVAPGRFGGGFFPRAPWVLFVHAMRRTSFSLGWHFLLGLVLVGYFVALLFVEYSAWRLGAPGLELYRWITYLNLMFIAVAGVGCFSVCVATEREAGTFDLLRLTNLGPIGFLFGCWMPLFVATGFFLILQIPCMCFVVTLGGVLPNRIQATTVATLVHILLVASVGYLISVFSKSTQRAVLISSIVFGVCFVGPDLMEKAFSSMWPASAAQSETFFEYVRSFSAFGSLERIDRTARLGLSLWGIEQSFQVTVAILALVLGGYYWERRSSIVVDAAAASSRQRLARRWLGGMGAVFQKDFNQAGGWNWVALRLIAYPVVGMMTVQYVPGFGEWYYWAQVHEIGLRMVGWETGIVLSQLFQREVQQQTWGGLRLLPVSRCQLAYVKSAGALAALSPGWIWTAYVSVVLESYGNPLADWAHLFYFASIVVFGCYFAVLMSVIIPRVTWTIPCMLGVVAAHLQLEFGRSIEFSAAFGRPGDFVALGLLAMMIAISTLLHGLTIWIIRDMSD